MIKNSTVEPLITQSEHKMAQTSLKKRKNKENRNTEHMKSNIFEHTP